MQKLSFILCHYLQLFSVHPQQIQRMAELYLPPFRTTLSSPMSATTATLSSGIKSEGVKGTRSGLELSLIVKVRSI